MKAARLHEIGKPLQIDEVPDPVAGAGEVVVKVEAVHVAPSMSIARTGPPNPAYVLPPLPAILGTDVAGVVESVGEGVAGIQVGQKVYVDAMLSMGGSFYDQIGAGRMNPNSAFIGLFTFSPQAVELLERYPGGLAEKIKIPASQIIPLSDSVSQIHAARLGYLGTAYHAVKRAGVGPGSVVVINGATGNLGVGAVMSALALGATRVIAIGRKSERLAQVQALAPERIATLASTGDIAGSIRGLTAGLGADALVDTLGYADTSTTSQAVFGLRNGGSAVMVGGGQGQLTFPYAYFLGTEVNLTGSLWFSHAEALELLRLIESRVIDLNRLDFKVFSLDQADAALELASTSPGGFTSVVVCP